MHNFPFKLPIRLDWSEMDMFGHINNVAYFKFIQSSRVNCWEVSKLAGSFSTTKIGPILLSTACQFMKPLYYPGDIVVVARIEFIKNTSFGIHHHILNAQGHVAAEAHDVIVMFDFNKNEKVPVPEEFRKLVEDLEANN